MSCVGCVVGAEALTESAGVWVKTRLYRKGPYLCATVYSVAAGEPKVFELKVDLRPIEQAVRRAHEQLHGKTPVPTGPGTVGWGLGSMWKGVKKAAQKIGRNKLIRGVVKVTKAVASVAKKVVKSKAFGAVLAVASVFPLTAPFAAPVLGAYAASNAAISSVEVGAKVVQTAKSAISLISHGKKAAQAVKSTTATAQTAVAKATSALSPKAKATLSARASAAGKLQLTAKGKVGVKTAIARAPAGAARAKVAAKVSAGLKQVSLTRSRAVVARALPSAAPAVARATVVQAQTAPLIARAARVQKALSNPATQKQLTDLRARGEKSAVLLQGIAKEAATGSLDGAKSAAIVNLVARNRARIQAMSQANAGGMPGLLITPQGKIVKGRFRVQAQAGGKGLLYLGTGTPTQQGSFATVAGDIIDRAFEVVGGAFDIVGSSIIGTCAGCVGAVVVPIAGALGSIIGINPTGCYRVGDEIIAGDLPLDGVRMSGAGPNARELGPYDVGSCGPGCHCGPCQAA